MSDVLLKLRILWRAFILRAWAEWRREVWSKDLDALYCCNGRECGCRGATVSDVFDPQEVKRLLDETNKAMDNLPWRT